MIILIPAYEPDRRLIDLVTAIRATDPDQGILVVDDGSGPGYDDVFAASRAAGAEVIRHAPNRGKGYALKAGFAHLADHHPDHDVVCADCDGQHTLTDIRRVAGVLAEHDKAVVLGARQFVGDVPARSRFGNTVTRVVFDVATGHRLQDTQTGLRGYPSWMLGWLQRIGGDRFEYELDVLLAAQREGFGFHEVPIETVYLDDNSSSHFRTVRDSVRVYVPVVKFCLSSLAAFAIDAILFFALMAITGNLAVSVVAARVVSATVNFSVNRTVVFASSRRPRDAAIRYASLVAAVLVANYLLLRLLTQAVAVPLVPAKLLTELTLFVVSYQVQRRVVFRSGRRSAATVAERVEVPDGGAPRSGVSRGPIRDDGRRPGHRHRAPDRRVGPIDDGGTVTEHTEIAIRTPTAADEAAVVQVLSEAFADDPVFSWIYPDPATHARVLPGFFTLFAQHSTRFDGNQLADDGRGAAIWVPPGAAMVEPHEEEAFGTALVALSPGDTERLAASDALFSAHHPTEAHWYLGLLGVADAHQGRGVGSAMLRAGIARSDETATPSYLEATKPENRRLYERHGFVVTDELRLPDGPPVWAMWREARV